jgi:hypothetical protein
MKNIEDLFDKLHSSDSEEEVIKNIKWIIKSFDVSKYKDRLMCNPYFSLIVSDIKGDILIEIGSVKNAIELEIKSIDEKLNDTINIDDFYKLKELKRECISLLYTINDRINDLILL